MCQTDPKTPAPTQDLRHVRHRSYRCERIVDNDKQFSDSQSGSPRDCACVQGLFEANIHQMDAMILLHQSTFARRTAMLLRLLAPNKATGRNNRKAYARTRE